MTRAMETPESVAERLEELRAALRAENISYGELAELQNLARYIEPGDTELLEPAGVPEFPEEAGTALGELDRAVWLLMQTDDYTVTGRGEGWAELIYVHNSPPHPVTRIEVRTPPA